MIPFESHNRYDKKTIEPYALSVISQSYDESYANFLSPIDTDNFDYLSADGTIGLEISLIITRNEAEAYEYEKVFHKGKKKPNSKRIKNATFLPDGHLLSHRGGSLGELWLTLRERIQNKHDIALKRLSTNGCNRIELCLCIVDGSLTDLDDFKYYLDDMEQFVFDRVFFITSSRFICYDKQFGFEEYTKIYT